MLAILGKIVAVSLALCRLYMLHALSLPSAAQYALDMHATLKLCMHSHSHKGTEPATVRDHIAITMDPPTHGSVSHPGHVNK